MSQQPQFQSSSQRLKEMLEQHRFTVFEWRHEETNNAGIALHRASFYFNGNSHPIGTSGWQPNKKAAREEAAWFALPHVSTYLKALHR